MDDHRIFCKLRKHHSLKNRALREQKIGIFKCMGACKKLACRHRFPSLQHIPIHINEYGEVKGEESNSRKFLSTEEAFNTSSETESCEGDVRSRAGITCHLEKNPQ